MNKGLIRFAGNNTQDSEAGYNVKTAADGKRKTTYGFKAHANVDEDGFVKKMTFTLGNVGGFTLAISCSFNIVARFRVLSVVAIFAFALARLFGFNDGGINNVD
jgi:hypothetical protein